MADRRPTLRTVEDLERAVRAVAFLFKTDTVYVIGSQAILATWPEAPKRVRMSYEIDAYPGNAKAWERTSDGIQASEEINSAFGYMSDFHRTHGFYIDGVDEMTASFPLDWHSRAIRRQILDVVAKTSITVVAPSIDDLVISKLARGDDKDKEFVEELHRAHPLDIEQIRSLLALTPVDAATARRMSMFLSGLRA